MDAIREFNGEYRFLSNFYPAPVEYEGDLYPCVENGYQAAKTEIKTLRRPFLTVSPGKAKYLGRKLPLRKDWDKQKEQFMELLLFEKFSRHRDLGDKLLATGTASLVEGNWWHDHFWGVCNGVGQNRLGILLMRVRAKIEKTRKQNEEREKF
jgi:N-glycosidase YbiA